MKNLTCTCCGADIAAPQFHNGKPYGYTCILKVVPKFKRTKDCGLWVECTITYSLNEHNQVMVRAEVDGKGFVDYGHRIDIVDSNRDRNSETRESVTAMIENKTSFNGFIRLSKTKDGSQPIWRNTKELIQKAIGEK